MGAFHLLGKVGIAETAEKNDLAEKSFHQQMRARL
jgi:hypothetical protein